MTITEFLEARIAEDEAAAKALLKDLRDEIREDCAGMVDKRGPMTPERLLSAQMWAHYDGQSKRRSFAKGQQIAKLASPARVLAECAAKRAIIEQADEADSETEYAISQSCINERERDEARATAPGKLIREALAAVYADHPDYQQEW